MRSGTHQGTPFRSITVQSLATNHPSTNYQNDELLTLLSSITRDDVIYGLKICAKKGYLLGR